MNRQTLSGLLIAAAALFTTAFDCAPGEGTQTKRPAVITPYPAPTPRPASKYDGTYKLSGRKSSDGSAYGGRLTVQPMAERLLFLWPSDLNRFGGRAVWLDDRIGVTFLPNDINLDCRVGVVRFMRGEEFEGYIDMPSILDPVKVRGVRHKAGDSIEGEYYVNGTEAYGNAANHRLTITKGGEFFKLTRTYSDAAEGVGLMEGDYFVMVFPASCGVGLYSVNQDGTLDGKIGFAADGAPNVETATKN